MNKKIKRTSPRRILHILEAIIKSQSPSTAAILSKSLDIPLPTVYRQLEILSEENFIILDPTGSYIPGSKFRKMALNSHASEPQVTRRRAIMRQLAGKLEETVSLSVPDGAKLVYFDRFESNWPVQFNLRAGDPLPLHCCASGKLYLSSFDRDAALEIFRNMRSNSHGPNTITTQKKFAQELEAIETRGYALDDEEWFDSMVGAAVPIRNKEGKMCASLSTHSFTMRKSIDQINANVPHMLKAAKSLEHILFDE